MAGIVDAHCHVAPNWYEPVESLLVQMDRHGVECAVLVQLLGCTDNDYLLDCASRYPDRLTAVVAVDPADPLAPRHLEALWERGAAGVRLRPTTRSPGEDPWVIWRTAQRLKLPVSCVGNTESFSSPDFHSVLTLFGGLVVVLEHLGGTSTPDVSDAQRAARARVLELAAFEQVHLKIPGLAEFLPRAPNLGGRDPPLDLSRAATVLAEILRTFSPRRLMWGSDFPVVASREGYGNALAWSRQVLRQVGGAQTDLVFTDTARRLFTR